MWMMMAVSGQISLAVHGNAVWRVAGTGLEKSLPLFSSFLCYITPSANELISPGPPRAGENRHDRNTSREQI